MSRGVINCLWQGRAGNTLFQAAHALAYGEKYNCEVRFGPWWGFKVFCLDYNPIREELPRRNEVSLINGETEVELLGYWQNKRSAIYTLAQIRRWFRFRPHIESALQTLVPAPTTIMAHLRRGDYAGYGYPLVSEESYRAACRAIGADEKQLCFVSEESPAVHPEFTGDLAHVPDFFRLAKSRLLLRANSSFSFWAGALVEAHGGRVFSPIVADRKGGVEHDVPFLQGNGARIADFDFVDPIEIHAS